MNAQRIADIMSAIDTRIGEVTDELDMADANLMLGELRLVRFGLTFGVRELTEALADLDSVMHEMETESS